MSKLGTHFKSVASATKEASATGQTSVVRKLAGLGVRCAKAFVEAREKVASIDKEELSGFEKAAEYGRDLAREHFVAELEKAAEDTRVSQDDVEEAKILVAAAAAQALMSELDEDEASDPAVQEHVIRVAAELAESNFDPAMLFESQDEEEESSKSEDEEDEGGDSEKADDKKEEKGE